MNNLDQLRVEVFSKQKILAKIYSEHGQENLFDYANVWKVLPPSDDTGVVFRYTKALCSRVYGEQIAQDCFSQCSQSPLVSTIDHHGILNHPFFINSNLIYSMRGGLKNLICFSTTSISLNNSSWPGCLLTTDQNSHMHRYSLFPDKIKMQPVLLARAFLSEDVNRVRKNIQVADFLTADNKQRLSGLVDEVFFTPQVLGAKSFSEQSSFISSQLWSKIFPQAPKLVYLSLEKLVGEILVNEIAKNPDHILHKLFFTAKGWESIEKYFFGSLGAFSGGHKGSFLFWGMDTNHHRSHLARSGQKLTSGNFSVSVDSSDISQAIMLGKLYPGSLVCFLVLLNYGVTCLGGFNQVNWLTNIKEKFIILLREWGELSLAGRLTEISTENFAEGSLAFLVNRRGQIYKPTGLDLFLQNDFSLIDKYKKLAKQITIRESIDLQLPEIYKVVTPQSYRNLELLRVTETEILEHSGVAKKITSILES